MTKYSHNLNAKKLFSSNPSSSHQKILIVKVKIYLQISRRKVSHKEVFYIPSLVQAPVSHAPVYDFTYRISVEFPGPRLGELGHRRDDDTAGSDFVNLPNGLRQAVTISVNSEDGFKAMVSRETTDRMKHEKYPYQDIIPFSEYYMTREKNELNHHKKHEIDYAPDTDQNRSTENLVENSEKYESKGSNVLNDQLSSATGWEKSMHLPDPVYRNIKPKDHMQFLKDQPWQRLQHPNRRHHQRRYQPSAKPFQLQSEPFEQLFHVRYQPSDTAHQLQNQQNMIQIPFQKQPSVMPFQVQNQPGVMPFQEQNQRSVMPFQMQNQPNVMPFQVQNQPNVMQFPLQNQPSVVPFQVQNQPGMMPFQEQNQRSVMPFQVHNQPSAMPLHMQNHPVQLSSL